MNKTRVGTIAHEMGHAVLAYACDSFYMPTEINLKPDEVNLIAYCDMETGHRENILAPSKFKGISDLGGAFGELIHLGEWNPWCSRADIDGFITSNKKSTNELILALDDWMWIRTDDTSFHAVSQVKPFEARYKVFYDHHDTAKILPHLFLEYCKFCDLIDKKTFRQTVQDLSASKIISIENEELTALMIKICGG